MKNRKEFAEKFPWISIWVATRIADDHKLGDVLHEILDDDELGFMYPEKHHSNAAFVRTRCHFMQVNTQSLFNWLYWYDEE